MILILADNRDLLYQWQFRNYPPRPTLALTLQAGRASASPQANRAARWKRPNDAALRQDDRALAAWKKGEVAPPPLVRLVALDRDDVSDRHRVGLPLSAVSDGADGRRRADGKRTVQMS